MSRITKLLGLAVVVAIPILMQRTPPSMAGPVAWMIRVGQAQQNRHADLPADLSRRSASEIAA
jgi:hypothetical protein